MRCRDKLAEEFPEEVDKSYLGGCDRCPVSYGYLAGHHSAVECEVMSENAKESCTKCWDQEVTAIRYLDIAKKEYPQESAKDIIKCRCPDLDIPGFKIHKNFTCEFDGPCDSDFVKFKCRRCWFQEVKNDKD